MLVEERKRLLQNPENEALRDEAANIMASIAHDPANYHGDPVILMALRSGAVRLILEHNRAAVVSVNDLLWQAATRIEDGSAGAAQRTLRDARQDLATAIDHNAQWQEIQLLTDHLQQAMNAYLLHIAAPQSRIHSSKKNSALPSDAAEKIVKHLHNLSATSTGSPARADLLKLREELDNFEER